VYAIQARRWIAVFRKATLDTVIEIWWCLAHRGIAGNEKVDEWANLAAEEPDADGIEWVGFADRYGRRPMPVPRSLAKITWEIPERKWAEARHCAEAGVKARKYRVPDTQQPCGFL
jgi:hypothetical protein